jgi:hypothetical protein
MFGDQVLKEKPKPSETAGVTDEALDCFADMLEL